MASSLCLPEFEAAKDDFTLISTLGRGQFSTVHKAFDRRRQEYVALKIVCLRSIYEEKTRADCIKEIRFLQTLHHPNIVELRSAFASRSGQELFLVLELADQGDLALVIAECRQKKCHLAECLVWSYFRQIAAALQYVHSRRILHRDIKPSNIFLSAHNRIKLGDLGFSRSMSVKTSSVDSFLGTPYYMSPERLKELKYSFPSDVWSLGCVLYEMVALQSPFFSKHISLNGLCKRIEMALFPPLPSGVLYSDKVGKIIESCLIPNPDLRPNIDALVQMSST